MAQLYKVCSLNELKQARTLSYEIDDHEGFVVYSDANVFAYRNSCPHIGMNLEFSENKFLDSDNKYIQCSMHGALFEIDSGLCIHGPCLNQHLKPMLVTVDDNQVFVSI